MILDQLFDLVGIGIVIIDTDMKVRMWNKWMELHGEIPSDEIIGQSLYDFFPNLNSPAFRKSVKYVLSFGSFYYFSQKLHQYLFPFKPVSSLAPGLEFMQQSCNMGRLTDENGEKYVYITVHDVTEPAVYEKALLERNKRDGLTGAYNRRHFQDRLNEEFKKCKQGASPFSIIMLDIDFFKNINDSFGHQCGDQILRSISSSISSSIKGTDLFARYGGEEFACLLPQTNIEGATHVAKAFNRMVREQIHDYQGITVHVTVSLGVAQFAIDNPSPDAVLRKADEALYEAKRGGRDRVVVASPFFEDRRRRPNTQANGSAFPI